MSIFLSKFLSTCIHSSRRGLVSIYLFKGLFYHPALLIHSKPVRKNYSAIFRSSLRWLICLYLLKSSTRASFIALSFHTVEEIFFYCLSKTSPTSFIGVTLSTSLQNAILPSFIPFFFQASFFCVLSKSLSILRRLPNTLLRVLTKGGLVYFTKLYPHSFLSEGIHFHIFFKSLVYHPSLPYHTTVYFLVECFEPPSIPL